VKVLLDTHTWAWALSNNTVRLSARAVELIRGAEIVFVSPISIFEIGQKVHRGKWPEMSPFLGQLADLLAQQGARFAALTPEVCLQAAMLPWENRDPFDRLLAATAIMGGLTYISVDDAFDQLNAFDGWIGRRW
jgi:PIN domain nuclease of toxin-antitoxin system